MIQIADRIVLQLTDVRKEYCEPMGTIEAVKTVADLFAPVTGVVKEINGALNDDPGIVNQSPYGEGWFVKIQLADKSELDGLMGKADYDRMVGKLPLPPPHALISSSPPRAVRQTIGQVRTAPVLSTRA